VGAAARCLSMRKSRKIKVHENVFALFMSAKRVQRHAATGAFRFGMYPFAFFEKAL